MNFFRSIRMRAVLLALISIAATALLNGCTTTEDAENMSARPWNSPRGWEHGLPTIINEGR